MKEASDKKLGLICSSGGHLWQLTLLEECWGKYNRFWVTFKKPDALSLLHAEKVYWAAFPTTRNIKNLLKNIVLAWKVLRAERPDILISNGAGVAVPFFWLGKLLGIKLIYIEVYDRVELPTLTGKLVYPIVDKFLLQWEEQKKSYHKGIVMGQII
ncbi:MAG: PssD/Cps14F family polysaccharide biosynthesis glycosyltransferase [Bacillota bacterium]